MKIKAAVVWVTGANRRIAASIVDARVAGGSSRIYAAVPTPPSAAKQGKVVPMALDITDAARVGTRESEPQMSLPETEPLSRREMSTNSLLKQETAQ